ncbi:MAG TPA: hydrolase [Lachnospiraceae bacterium]|nr:hydrolase [Lachnospiraceae bacterium]
MGADIADTIAFGDSMNDMAMIRTAGLSVAMGNSEQRIKDAADIVCESCADSGIAKELERLGLTRP